jgi:hypothetical protein
VNKGEGVNTFPFLLTFPITRVKLFIVPQIEEKMNLQGVIAILKLESMTALKEGNRDRREVVNLILSDLKIDGKEPDETVGLEKAFSVLKGYKKALEKGGKMEPYIEVLEPLLPSFLTKDELRGIVEQEGFKNMGEAMRWFKSPENKDLLFFEPSTLKQLF